jgi:hypothetical protein
MNDLSLALLVAPELAQGCDCELQRGTLTQDEQGTVWVCGNCAQRYPLSGEAVDRDRDLILSLLACAVTAVVFFGVIYLAAHLALWAMR